jgi:hypothetical protein
MKIAMTLMVRDEADIIERQIDFHRAAGVDFFIVERDPRALRRRRHPPSHPGRQPGEASGGVGHAHGAHGGSRVRRRLGDQLGRG